MGGKRNNFLLLAHPPVVSSSSSTGSSSSLKNMRELTPNVLLEPTPIDPTGMLTVKNVPFAYSSLCKVVDESFLASLINLLEQESNDSSSFWSETPVHNPSPSAAAAATTARALGLVEDDLEQESKGQKLVDFSSNSVREDLVAWWSEYDHIEELRRMDVVSPNHYDDYESHATTSTHSFMDCCSPEPSNNCVPLQNNRTPPPLTSVISKKKKIRRKNNHSARAFRMHQSSQWYKRYLDLVDFRKKYGHCLIPLNWPPNPSLAHWVSCIQNELS
jgi:hypothetical protein